LTQVNAVAAQPALDAAQSLPRRLESPVSIRNIDAFFAPNSIALIGASHHDHKIGSVIAHNLFSGGFKGPIMPVNPHSQAIRSMVAYHDIGDLPMDPDLAVIATWAETVPAIIGPWATGTAGRR
jgi:acetyltransferase